MSSVLGTSNPADFTRALNERFTRVEGPRGGRMLYNDGNGNYSVPGNDGGSPSQRYYQDVAERMSRGEAAPAYRGGRGGDRGDFGGGDGGGE
ncbi:MAG: hypothetical protein IPJ65_03120 [Archangiaceae bacterium]|nr:hypothetical protein [Archangiaceae bacterium]